MNYITLFCLSVFVYSFSIAQKQPPLKEFDQELTEIRSQYYQHKSDTSKQIFFAKKLIEKARQKNNRIVSSIGYYYLFNINKKNYQYIDSAIVEIGSNYNEHVPVKYYIWKGVFYQKKKQVEKSIEAFLKAKEYADISQSEFYKHRIKYCMAHIKSEYLKEHKEALQLGKDCMFFFDFEKDPVMHLKSIACLSDIYSTIKQYDSASFYNQLGFNLSKKTNRKSYQVLFSLFEGINQIHVKKFDAGLDNIKKVIPWLKKHNDHQNLLAAYYGLGEVYFHKNKNRLAIDFYTKVDSIYNFHQEIRPDFLTAYNRLINYYQSKQNKDKQLHFTNQLGTINNKHAKLYQIAYKTINQKYTIPILLKEKQTKIKGLEQINSNKSLWIIFLFLGVLLIMYLWIKQKQQKKLLQKRFDDIITNTKSDLSKPLNLELNNSKPNQTNNTNHISNIVKVNIKEPTSNQNSSVSDSITSILLNKLESFEREKGFLQSDLTINALASQFQTNEKYLSKVINSQKEKKFNHYINNLRIDYIIERLKNEKQLRQYTIKSIAEESGFNNTVSFNSAFVKKTGIKPSYFIEKLKKTLVFPNTNN